jgi:hypothetical protein
MTAIASGSGERRVVDVDTATDGPLLPEGGRRGEGRETERAPHQCVPTTRISNDPGSTTGRGRGAPGDGAGGGPSFAAER